MNLQERSVLFIGPRTFGYEDEIKRELELAGYKVDWYDERPASTPLVKALIRMRPKLLAPINNAYFDRIIKAVERKRYEVVFIIKGEALSVTRLESLRKSQPSARFLYYTWDSLSNFKNGHDKLVYFDKVYSFDRFDCMADKRVVHLPLFYGRAYEALSNSYNKLGVLQDIDLLFLGTIHSDRYEVVQAIWRACKQAMPSTNLYTYFYYQSRWVFGLRQLIDKGFRSIPWSDVRWKALDAENTLSLIARSNILIDVHHPQQTGLTMRTIESLGAQKKIITTNPDVRNYDFFKSENILIVDRNKLTVSKDFLKEPYKPVERAIYDRYSLREWLKVIFSPIEPDS